ncbi:MAG: RnfABCDGE type electron transport complex subunit D [Planctomycetota bacterium]|jgi:electron transport complex protein RnfD|nr:RnfABCDGE type electron transport complex subunit D [Planctomycetota bacterium]
MTAEEKLLLNVSNSPHIHYPDSTPGIMWRVVLALLPSLVWAVVVFGWCVLVPVLAAVLATLATEWLCQRWRGLPSSLGDGSAVVTGVLLAAVSPFNLPWWAAVLGGVFAIAVVKQAFGGLGHNIWNPALLARAFLQTSMPASMMSNEWPSLTSAGHWWKSLGSDFFSSLDSRLPALAEDGINALSSATPVYDGVNAVTGATVLEAMHSPVALAGIDAVGNTIYAEPLVFSPTWGEVWQTWLGVEGGALGEVSAILLLLGGAYLIWRRIITWDIPFFYLLSVALLGWLLPHPFRIGADTAYTAWFSGPWLMHLGGGGLFLGAFFMATDLVTSPLTRSGRIIFALGCGVMTVVIRLYGGYPEGVCYAILLMNTCVPLLDSWTRPRVFGTKRH